MDLANSGFLRAISGFGSLASMSSEMSPRDKRILSQIEKALASFDDLDEWADYIAFLARLKKLLLLPAENLHLILWMPLADQVLAKLALCLSPLLPNGVHSKTLELYENIFDALDVDLLNRDISIWLPGILPVVSFGSMQVKPHVISLYEKKLLNYLTPATLKEITQPLLLSLLCGLDDETSEVFGDVMGLLDSFKSKLNNNSHFWQHIFLSVITSPEKRLGALNWCVARLPAFVSLELDPEPKFSAEAQACLSSEPGLLIRAFVAALNTCSSFNQANDIIVMRGFLDLLLSHLQLDSPVFTNVIPAFDKELLIMACCRVTLKKDMSLNRRLWKWLLGPDTGEETLKRHDRKSYFATHALPVIDHGLKHLIASNDAQRKLDAYNISLAMIIDRWEISEHITALIFEPIIESSFEAVQAADARAPELLAAGKRFFDQVETFHIWHYMTYNLILRPEAKHEMLIIDFLVRNFSFPDDETNVHAPLAIIAFLLTFEATESTVSTLELLSELVLPKALISTNEMMKHTIHSRESLLHIISEYYSTTLQNESEVGPISANEISYHLLTCVEQWYIQCMYSSSLSDRVASLLFDFLTNFADQKDICLLDEGLLKESFLQFPECDEASFDSNQCSAPSIFGMVKLYRFVMDSMSLLEKSKMLKIILSNLWATLISPYPANYQVEAVKCILDLRFHFDVYEIEAGISYLILHTPYKLRLHCFYKLWSLSQDVNESDLLLSNPVFIVLDCLRDSKPGGLIDTQKFLHNVCNDGSANRFLKLVTNPLLTFPIMRRHKSIIDPHDDFLLFTYYLETILNLLHSNEKALKESLAHEFVPADNAGRVELFTSNRWDVSNYKSLLCNIIQKCLSLRFPNDVKLNENAVSNFTNFISRALELYSFLLTGSEPDFHGHFDLLIQSCLYFISDSGLNKPDSEIIESIFIKHLREFLNIAKSMNANVLYSKKDESNSPSFVAFINRGIQNCSSPNLLEKWLNLMNSTLYLLGNQLYGEMLTFNQTIIQKMNTCFTSIKNLENLENCFDSESFLSICFKGLEDLLSISHSYLVMPSLILPTKAQQGENGFFGNVILGVFQIESPLVKSEEELRLYSVISAFQDAIKTALAIWSWANSKPIANGRSMNFSSQKSISYMSNKIKFRAKKLLGSLSELERQETIESILESDEENTTKIKIIHVLDSGHSQLSLPHILNSILTRCSPLILTEKQKSTMFSNVSEKSLAQFLIPYYASIDLDTMYELWDMTLNFFKEVSLHPANFKHFLLTILQIVRVVSLKIQASKHNDGKRNIRELSNHFLSILNAAVSKKSVMVSSEKSPTSAESEDVEDDYVEELALLVGSFGDIIHEQDRIATAVNTIISTVILTQAKPKAHTVSSSTLNLLLEIGKHYPIKSWKHVIYDTFMESNFFPSGKYDVAEWKAIIAIWISNDAERMNELVNKITPPVQSSAANIFIWNENSEVEDRAMVLRRISYLILILPKDCFVKRLDSIFGRLSTALNSSCPALYKSEALLVFRALSLSFSEGHLLPYWSFVIQKLVEVFSAALAKNTKQFGGIETDELALILSACKLLDQLLLLQFDEVNLSTWLFVSRGSVVNDDSSSSLIDRLALKSESLLAKDDPVNVNGPRQGEKAKPLLEGTLEVKNIANLKKFFGLLGYINFERLYGLVDSDLDACKKDLMQGFGKQWS